VYRTNSVPKFVEERMEFYTGWSKSHRPPKRKNTELEIILYYVSTSTILRSTTCLCQPWSRCPWLLCRTQNQNTKASCFRYHKLRRLLAHPVSQIHTQAQAQAQAQPTDDYQAKDEGSKPHLHHIISFTLHADDLLPWCTTHQIRHMFPVRPHTDRMKTLGTAFQSYGQHKYVKLLFIFVSSV
jgi:hypothetical protein